MAKGELKNETHSISKLTQKDTPHFSSNYKSPQKRSSHYPSIHSHQMNNDPLANLVDRLYSAKGQYMHSAHDQPKMR